MGKYSKYIELIKLRPAMYSITCRLIGERLFSSDIQQHDVIKGDILTCFSDIIAEVILGLDIENVDDTRTYKQAIIFNADLLIRFHNIHDDNQEILQMIIDYLGREFVSPITPKEHI